MNNKIIRNVASAVMVATLTLASCGPKATTAPASSPTPTPAPTSAPKSTPAPPTTPGPNATLTPVSEKPKYGGTINYIKPSIVEKYDAASAPG